MALKILIASGTDWPFPARLAFAFAGLGARVEGVCLKINPLRFSAGPSRLHPFSALTPARSLARAIERAKPDLFIPCDDLMAELAWRLGQADPAFAPLLERSCGNSAAFPLLAARNDFLREAKAAGAPAADTIALETEADLDLALAQFGLPLVLKADGSWGGAGVAIARDASEARDALQRFAHPSRLKLAAQAIKRGDPSRLVRALMPLAPRPGAQRFVTGHPATSAIACWRGQLLAAHHFDVTVASAEDGTGPATVVTRTDCAAMADSARKIAARFGLSGLYGLDYMRDQSGSVFLLEINPRATPTSHLALGMGHDLVAALMNAAGQPTPDRPAVTEKSRIALFPQEMGRDPASPHLTAGYHDLPLGDPRLMTALGGSRRTLTSFSPAFSGLSSADSTPNPAGR
jgi:predicted ATP-grasp superfamily ATP-dependent carboligase